MSNRFENLQREFPDFDIATLPAIPASFEDTSWHNDTCPSFLDEKAGLILFVDYADADKREYPETTRFNVNKWDDGNTGETVVESDDWSVVVVTIATIQAGKITTDIADKIRLAREFGTLIQETLFRHQFRDMVDRNKGEPMDSPVCHSHDFTDANMLMLEAFETTFGRKPSFLDNADDESDMRLWADAWQIAKAADFFA